MTVQEQVEHVIEAYYKIGFKFIDDKSFLELDDVSFLDKTPWLKNYFYKNENLPFRTLMKNEFEPWKEQGVYDQPIFVHTKNITGVHYLMKHFLFYYTVWILKEDLANLIKNAKGMQTNEAKYNTKDNSLIIYSYHYDDVVKELANSINGRSVVKFISFFTKAVMSYSKCYRLNLNDLEKCIEDCETDFNFKEFNGYLNAYKIIK